MMVWAMESAGRRLIPRRRSIPWMGPQVVIEVNQIGEYVQRRSCPRRFRLDMNGRQEARELPFFTRILNPLDPVLQEMGLKLESDWEGELVAEGSTKLNPPAPEGRPCLSWEDFSLSLGRISPGVSAFAREVEVTGTIGRFSVRGRLDFAVLRWSGDGPRLRIVECKASRKDKTYHRIQLATYLLLVRSILSERPLSVAGRTIGPGCLEGVVARLSERGNGPAGQRMMDLHPLDLGAESHDVLRLLGEGGVLDKVSRSGLPSLGYSLDGKCDSCVFNVHCLPESARMRRLELLGLDASSCEALRANGIAGLDGLASLDPASERASRLRRTPGFERAVDDLVARAKARISTLPGSPEGAYEVEPLPHRWRGQLPPHLIEGRPLVRVFVSVDYDYVEDRLGALAAHVTCSDWGLLTELRRSAEGRWEPDPRPVEAPLARDQDQGLRRPVRGRDVVRFKGRPWKGDDSDRKAEAALVQSFLSEVMESIVDEAGTSPAPVHFYFWSRDDLRHLIEACSRGGAPLLDALTHLLGCREPLEQLIYSCLREEVYSRYATGWTGQGLVVAASLRWFGKRYHWVRELDGRPVPLDRLFHQDLFDFRAPLALRPDGEWAGEGEDGQRHEFEVRARFHDGLPVPYWHAIWGRLPRPDGASRKGQEALARYSRVDDPRYLAEYLKARVQAMRWLEERIVPKNQKLRKEPLDLASLPDFKLTEGSTLQAALDFLRMERHVALNDWLARCSLPVRDRVARGETIPVRECVHLFDGGRAFVEARLDLERFGEDPRAFRDKCPLEQDSWVRLTPYEGDLDQGQAPHDLLYEGATCRVLGIDYDQGRLMLEVVRSRPDRYRLVSREREDRAVQGFAVLDESMSDNVSGRVDDRLVGAMRLEAPRAATWFDILRPNIPPAEERPGDPVKGGEAILRRLSFDGHGLGEDQVEAIMEGLQARVQLMQGPPGTGKTTTLAASVLLRASELGRKGVVLVAANTHAAVYRILEEVERLSPSFAEACAESGARQVPIEAVNLDDVRWGTDYSTKVASRRGQAALVLGGTTNQVLRLAENMSRLPPYVDGAGFSSPLLVIDEASMMPMPHLLALATVVDADGRIVLAGDNRQLSPIITHDWEEEDRPLVQLYQPFSSAYDAVANLASAAGVDPRMVTRSSLCISYRLPHEVRELICSVYRQDGIELRGTKGKEARRLSRTEDALKATWDQGGVYLVLHDESSSKKLNRFEAALVGELVRSGRERPAGSLAVITPHRAQRTLLTELLKADLTEGDVVDTVERLQGGERSTVVVSGTQSDPSSISGAADFILDMNRSNVIFSRAKERLVVVCARTLLDSVPAEVEQYRDALLWKGLRDLCTKELGSFSRQGIKVDVLVPDLDHIQVHEPRMPEDNP